MLGLKSIHISKRGPGGNNFSITGPLYGKPLVTYHYNDVIMSAIPSQITSLTIVYPTVYSGADQRKHQNSPHKWPVTRKMSLFDDVIIYGYLTFLLAEQVWDPTIVLLVILDALTPMWRYCNVYAWPCLVYALPVGCNLDKERHKGDKHNNKSLHTFTCMPTRKEADDIFKYVFL